MVSKMPNVTWPKGTFVETVKEWQKLWFYITDPHDATWAASPEFKSRSPMQFTSWLEKGLNWSSSDELMALQTLIQSMVDKNIKLVNVIQVMLVRRILPWQSRTCHLWEFNPAEHQILQQFFGTTREDIWKVLFKGNERPPETTEDRGHALAHPANPVSFSYFKVYPLLVYSRKMPKLPYLFVFGAGQRRQADSLSGSAA